MIRHENESGSVNVSTSVYTDIVGTAASNCFGVKGMAARSVKDGVFHLLRPESMSKGVLVSFNEDDTISIDTTTNFAHKTVPQNVDNAWLYGFLLCDSTFYDSIVASIALSGEDDIQDRFTQVLKDRFGLDVKVTEQHRGTKGHYKDLRVIGDDSDKLIRLKAKLTSMFEGKAKIHRHIPNEVFSWQDEAKFAFLAGMMDADGGINPTGSICHAQIGSTNKELAVQQALLAQSIGMRASIYLNHYNANYKDNIRYRVEFIPTEKLISHMACKKKTKAATNLTRTNNRLTSTASLRKVEIINKPGYSYDLTTASEHFTVSGIYSHNCRSFLTVDRFTDKGLGNIAKAKNYTPGKHKYYGRFNQGVVTINLPDVALSSGGDMDKFWEIYEERLELCHRALRLRHEHLLGTTSDVAPILWQHGALARLAPGEKIDPLLYNGYSTISLGYAGLYECVRYMTGASHTGDGKAFGLAVMQKLNDKCAEWKAAENIDYSPYGTPIESTTYKFAKCLQRRFGLIEGITDHNYITNSYHVNVREEIDAFSKLTLEAEFQKLSPGGAVSYCEVPDMQHNIPAVLEVIRHIYDHIMYAELNTKSDYCCECGWDGEIKIVTDANGKLIWECPNCGNRDQSKMSVVRRTCGYLGTNFWNQGRTEEIQDRVLHL